MLCDHDLVKEVAKKVLPIRIKHSIIIEETGVLLGITAMSDLYAELESYLTPKQKEELVKEFNVLWDKDSCYILSEDYSSFEYTVLTMICGYSGAIYARMEMDKYYGRKFAYKCLHELIPIWTLITWITTLFLNIFYSKYEVCFILMAFILVIPIWGILCYWLYIWDCGNIQERFNK